jgi:hypothetical protein
MAVKTWEQGQTLNRIDDVIIDTKDYAVKAEKEITKSEEETRRNSKKIACLVGIIVFVIISITLIVYFSLH